MNEQRTRGKIKFYSQEKGFGFIKGEAEEGIFFHRSGVQEQKELKYLIENEQVEFQLAQGTKGLKAIEIKMISKKPWEKK